MGGASWSNLLINSAEAWRELEEEEGEEEEEEEEGREDRFNEDSCRDGSSRLLCGPVNKPGRQMGWGIDQWRQSAETRTDSEAVF